MKKIAKTKWMFRTWTAGTIGVGVVAGVAAFPLGEIVMLVASIGLIACGFAGYAIHNHRFKEDATTRLHNQFDDVQQLLARERKSRSSIQGGAYVITGPDN